MVLRGGCAYHLAEHATERPIEHEDRVVARVANIFADCRDGRDDMEVTDVHLGIKEAVDIAATASLERDILEARLLAQQYAQDIAARSRFSQYTIAAYGSLYFDVGGQQGVQRWLGGTPHGMPFMPLLNLTLGGALKMLADRNGSEALEDAIEVVCGLAGPTLRVYRNKLLQDAGSPSDPIEIMLIEQLALAHFNVGRLQIKSCSVEDPKLAVAFSDAATRLLGEFRRCTLALEDFRAKQAARKDRNESTADAEKKSPAEHNGTPRPSTNGKKPSKGKKKARDAQVTTNGEIPQCLKDRMQSPIPGVLQPTGVTGRNGKG